VALSVMEKWGITDDETATNLSALYNLLREQFQDPDDPWCKETLEWWNECVPVLHSPGSCIFIDCTLAKSSQTPPMTTMGETSGIWRVRQ